MQKSFKGYKLTASTVLAPTSIVAETTVSIVKVFGQISGAASAIALALTRVSQDVGTW